jgi:ATP-dependent DNA helicase DinG
VLLEAGTGTGKTLGYLAPASLWAERNHGPVWISTFTRHLQRQIEAELARLFPDPAERRRRAVLRKGRENYLCLLNLEDAVNTVGGGPGVILLGLIARWAMASADGDLLGGDLPGWFGEVFGAGMLAPLADRRGECIHSACTHWRRCFVEHSIRRARHADIVVANHALVMAQAVWGGLDDAQVPTHYVFDEGHHLFDAADAAFAVRLSGAEGAELRRWLLGPEGGRARGRGLRARLADLLAEQPELEAPLEAALQAARGLAAPGWSSRLGIAPLDVGPANPMEALLALLHQQVLARRGGESDLPAQGSMESDFQPPLPGLLPAAERLGRALARLAEPLATLRGRHAARLDDAAAELDSAARNRIEALCRSLGRRALDRLTAWQALLRDIAAPPAEPGSRPERITLLHLDRRDGLDRDIGLHQHWLDPTQPFAAALAAPAQGLLITSATLRDAGVAAAAAWEAAEARTGALHLPSPAIRAAVASPFDYARQTRAFIVNDLAPGDPAALAGAYRALFLAAGGGALGLFTAISRLRAVHARIAPALEAAGIPLLAQHVDAMDNATLVDLFRTEEESCLLGTDAMRDGVDVPGRALRLVVFERVPWPRPDILHRERRVHLSGGAPGEFDAGLARLRLRQAFGRLIRRESDRGVFVLLDRRTPSRLLAAFPAGGQPRRVGLAEAVAETAALLAPPG